MVAQAEDLEIRGIFSGDLEVRRHKKRRRVKSKRLCEN